MDSTSVKIILGYEVSTLPSLDNYDILEILFSHFVPRSVRIEDKNTIPSFKGELIDSSIIDTYWTIEEGYYIKPEMFNDNANPIFGFKYIESQKRIAYFLKGLVYVPFEQVLYKKGFDISSIETKCPLVREVQYFDCSFQQEIRPDKTFNGDNNDGLYELMVAYRDLSRLKNKSQKNVKIEKIVKL
jgi:hypothetical protein